MQRHVIRSRRAIHALAVAVSLSIVYALPAAQSAPQPGTKKVLSVEDYAKWRSLSSQEIRHASQELDS